eukprot:11205494-Lingulodinium_polyedra.AAC.1
MHFNGAPSGPYAVLGFGAAGAGAGVSVEDDEHDSPGGGARCTSPDQGGCVLKCCPTPSSV